MTFLSVDNLSVPLISYWMGATEETRSTRMILSMWLALRGSSTHTPMPPDPFDSSEKELFRNILMDKDFFSIQIYFVSAL